MLRLVAEQQLESGVQPVVLIDISTEEGKLGEDLALRELRLRNIGTGPAFGVRVAAIHGVDMALVIPELPLMEAKDIRPITEPAIIYTDDGKRAGDAVPEIKEEIERRAGDLALILLRKAISKKEFPSDGNIFINFRSVSGKLYRVTQKISPLEPKGIRTDFVKLEPFEKEHRKVFWGNASLNLVGLVCSLIGSILLAYAVTLQPSHFKLVEDPTVTFQGGKGFAICHDGKKVVGGFGGPLVPAGNCPAEALKNRAPTPEIVADRPAFARLGIALIIAGFALQVPSAFAAMKEQ